MPGFEQIAVPIIGGILGMLGGGGGGQSNEAIAAQLGLSRQLMDMLQRQQNVALPYQQSLLSMLQGRAQRQFPVRRPGEQPVFNPFGGQGAQQPYQIGQAQQNSLPLGPFLSRPTQPPWVRNVGGRPIIGKPALGGQ